MSRKNALLVAGLFAVIHLVLACLYASSTPYRTGGLLLGQGRQQIPDIGAPDERQHANYVQHLLDGKGFPVLDPKDPNLIENYQAHQPPLYYILQAGWTKITGTDLTSRESGLMARMPNAFIGAATVIGTFFLALWAFRREDVGLLAAGFVALLPMNTALSGAMSNDPLLYCLCTWTLAFIAKGCVDGWSIKVALFVGACTGLSILTKTTAVALLPILLLSLFIGPNKPSPKAIAACAVLLLAIATPWLLRNQSHYGDPLGISAFNEAFKNSPSPAIVAFSEIVETNPEIAKKLEDYMAAHPDLKGVELIKGADADFGFGATKTMHYWADWVGWWTARSFFGAFGYMDIFLNEHGVPSTDPKNPNTLYRILIAMSVLVVAAWAVALKKPEWSEHKRMHWLLGAFLFIVTVLFLRFNAQYFQGQARYLFPAISVFGIGTGIALLSITRGKLPVALGVLAVFLTGLNVYALTRLPEEFKRRTLSVQQTQKTDLLATNVLMGNAGNITRV